MTTHTTLASPLEITTSAPVKSRSDSAEAEVESIQNWSEANQMTSNLSKTREMVVHGGSMRPLPAPIVGIERKSWLKLLGVTFQENPWCWDLHIDDLGLDFPKSFPGPSMARFTSSVERTFVTCSAPNITGGKIHR
jgi:hypothetical protein